MSSRFTVAVHILALLAIEKKAEPTTSEYLARSAGTNPVVIRRILSPLRKAGLVNVQPGVGGGAILARRPEQITLRDVYRIVGEELFSYGSRKKNPFCICNRNLEPVLTGVFQNAQNALENALAETTVAQIAQEIETRDARTDWDAALPVEL
ncbi:MAG: Rrf2 family transcriptional regulator [Anaerolineales bacterium]